MTREVVITGLGVISPIGIGADAVWNSISQCKTGVTKVELYDGFASPGNVGGECRDFNEESIKKIYLKDLRKSIKVMCREIQLGVASALLALENSGIKLDSIDRERLGVEFGANLMLSAPDVLSHACSAVADPVDSSFQFDKWGSVGMPRLEPLWLLKFLPNMPACHIGIAADARGPNNSLTLDDASGGTVMAEACRIIDRGAADVMITGCTGTTLHPIKTLHLALDSDLAETPVEPERRARPFDLHRSGRVVAEGACTFMFEAREFAEARGAKILGRVVSTGSSVVTDRKGVPKYQTSLANAMRAALKSAQMSPEQIGHINAHGLGTQEIDREEAAAIHEVFGALGKTIPVTAPKSFMGNAGAPSAMLEMAVSLCSLHHGVIPPTLNYETPDPACQLNIVTKPQATSNKVFLSLNITRAGQATAVIIEAA